LFKELNPDFLLQVAYRVSYYESVRRCHVARNYDLLVSSNFASGINAIG